MAQQNKPQLRFPKFNEDFKHEPIGKYIDLLSGFAFKGEDITEDNSGIPLLRGINITEGRIRHNKEIDRYYLGNTKKLEKYFLKKGDLVLGMDGSKVGKNVALIDNDDTNSLLIQRVARIRSNTNADINYIYQHITSKKFHTYVDIVNTSSGIPHISSQQIKDFTIGFPTLPEQQKIASFLSVTDKKLEQLQQKKNLLEQYKKGMMQKLFSQQIRFKNDNGMDFPEWEELFANKIFKNHSNKNHDGDLPILSASQMYGMVLRDDNGIKIQASENSVKSYKIVEQGDFVISLRSFQGGIEYSHIKGICSPAYIILKPLLKIDNNYFSLYFKYDSFIERLSKTVVGIRDGKQITYDNFSSLKLPMPSVNEQTKIADFLSAIDSKIYAVSAQVNKTKEFKKGLLQQMFV